METRLALLLILPILAMLAWQACVVGYEYLLRWRRYRSAGQYAQAKGKPLLVVGRPGGVIRLYGCGDVTLDISPKVMSDCLDGGMVGDVRHIPFPDRHFGAAFCSHVLDVLDRPEDVAQALGELHRVAERVFICYTLSTNLYWRFVSREIKVWLTEQGGAIHAQKKPW